MARPGQGPWLSGTATGSRSGRRLVAWQVGQFALVGVVALAIVALATSIASRRVGEREAIADARITTVIRAQGLVTPVLTDDLVAGDESAIARVDEVVRRDVLDDSLVRVKVWAADGRIVYSDEPELIGTSWELGEDKRESMATGRIEAGVSDLTEPENLYERGSGKLLEVYLPVATPSGEVLLFEAYYRYGLVTAQGERLWRSFAPIAIGALVLLELVQIPLAWSLARRLRQRMRERESLLHRALEASDIERRRIASDLHDGVVQDLTGVAFALSAAARREPDPVADRTVIGESADSVRASIRELRTLLVDIYPPDFDDTTLESALADLLSRANEQGIATQLDTGGLRDPLPDPVARILYRSIQEGLRNALDHAHAGTITVSVGTENGVARASVADDGAGFDPDVLPQRHAEGHLGLTALRGLLTDAGGTLEITTRPGAGTTICATVPLP